MKNSIEQLLKRSTPYHSLIAKATDSVVLAILWQQIYYWSDKGNDPDGWIYKTQNDIYDELGFSRKQQETARHKGEKLGVLETKRMGEKGIVHFRVNVEKMWTIIDEFAEKHPGKKIKIAIKHVMVVGKPTAEINFIPLPGWINREMWEEWECYRKDIKKKITERTRQLQLKMLEQNKNDHVEIIKQSIQNGWTGLFPLKGATLIKRSTPGKFDNLKSTKV